jgi:hypothetical protein
VAMVAAYFAPLWWVSLTAPNYPEDAFPDGIRIHFHFDGVKNGCSTPPKTARLAEETMAEDMGEGTGRFNPILAEQTTLTGKAAALDCVHEMNTINHYVGMFPIATGAPVEKAAGQVLLRFLRGHAAHLRGADRKLRLGIMGVGFGSLAAWMIVDQFVMGNLAAHVKHYMDESATFFNDPERIGLGRQRRGHLACRHLRHDRRHGRGRLRRAQAAQLRAAAGAGAGLLPLFFVIDLRRLAVVLRPQPAPLGRLHGQALHAHRVRRRQGGAVLDLLLSATGATRLLMVVFFCLLLALLLRRKQLREEQARTAA